MQVGFEPTTFGLLVRCSTNCATEPWEQYVSESLFTWHMQLVDETDDIKLINHILLTFKHSLYNCRDALTLPNFFYERERLKQAQKIEYKIAKDRNAPDLHLKKWERIIPKF